MQKNFHNRLLALSNVFDKISIFVGYAMSFIVILLVMLIVFEVVLRYFFKSPTTWGTELQIFLYGTLCMLCISYATYKKSHARVDILLKKFSKKWQYILGILYIFLFSLPFMVILLIFESKVAYHSWLIQEHSTWSPWQPLLYPIKSMIPLGAALFIFQCISDLLKIIANNEDE